MSKYCKWNPHTSLRVLYINDFLFSKYNPQQFLMFVSLDIYISIYIFFFFLCILNLTVFREMLYGVLNGFRFNTNEYKIFM